VITEATVDFRTRHRLGRIHGRLQTQDMVAGWKQIVDRVHNKRQQNSTAKLWHCGPRLHTAIFTMEELPFSASDVAINGMGSTHESKGKKATSASANVKR